MPAPETALATRLRAVIDAEFAADGIAAEDDTLLQAAAQDRPRIALSPDVWEPADINELVGNSRYVVQMYQQWTATLDEHKVVSPEAIVAWVERLRQALRTQSSGTADSLWYLSVSGVDYLTDPSGKTSRAHVFVTGTARNPAILETIT